jgi:hypothetical protein
MLPILLGGSGLILASLYMQGPTNNVRVRSNLDNKEYLVQNLPDKQEAANLLSKLKKNLQEIIDELKQTQHNPPYERLYANFNPDVFEENDITASTTSYSENKGQKIIVCMRDKTKEPYPFIDENTIMFVLLHELSHLMTESIGHTPEFWNNFRMLLQDCIKNGKYTPVNYTQNPVEYCGMTISDSPL